MRSGHAEASLESSLVDVPNDVWTVADRFLFDGRIIEAVEHLREVGSVPLQEAIVAVDERVGFLKANQAERFTVPLETYGQGFYS
jgi:hypothetical protein